MVGLVNNFHALLTKLGQPVPEEPLYFLKAPSSFMGPDGTIEQPKFYSGRVVFEGELGIVIGKRCKDVDEAEALSYVLGYTCVNDVTGFDVLNKDPQFAQWARAKSYDAFGIFGPVVASGLDPAALTIRSVLAGEERQNYPVSDMVFGPAKLVSALSRDMTLLPGDVIACGTSVGAGRMKSGKHDRDRHRRNRNFEQHVCGRIIVNICIIGAGAIGGMLGAKLAIAGNDVTFVEPNRIHAEAIARNGLARRRPSRRALARRARSQGHARHRLSRTARPDRDRRQSAIDSTRRAHAEAAARCRYGRHDRSERNPVVVLPETQRAV